VRAARLQDALERLTTAIRDVEPELAGMKAEHDPLDIAHLCFALSLSERHRYEKRKTPRDDRPSEFQYCLRAWLSRQPRRMRAPDGSSCEAVNDCSTPNGGGEAVSVSRANVNTGPKVSPHNPC